MTYLNATVTNLLFSYNTSTLRITIATKNNTTINLLPISNNAYELLGFSDSGTSSNSNSILAPYMFNLISVQVLHVCTSNIVLNSYGLKNKTKRNIIGSVQVTSSSGEVQTFTSSFKNKIHTDPISSITISIFNQDFNTVNFNNIDWFINLSFSFCYRKKLEMPQYLNTINLESQMQYYIEEEESRNKNKVLDSLLDKKINI